MAPRTRLFSHGSFQPRVHTYPDYATLDTVAFFNGLRAAYLEQLRSLRG
jgi:hypothetical protein